MSNGRLLADDNDDDYAFGGGTGMGETKIGNIRVSRLTNNN